MNIETARKLVAQVLPGYQVQQDVKTDAAEGATRKRAAIEVISPSLRKLKSHYFGDNASHSSIDSAAAEDSGIVVVEKSSNAGVGESKAMVFSKGVLRGRQG